MHFIFNKTELVRNIRSKTLKKKNEEHLRDIYIKKNHPPQEEKGRNHTVQIKESG